MHLTGHQPRILTSFNVTNNPATQSHVRKEREHQRFRLTRDRRKSSPIHNEEAHSRDVLIGGLWARRW